jgi:hypothetical protein
VDSSGALPGKQWRNIRVMAALTPKSPIQISSCKIKYTTGLDDNGNMVVVVKRIENAYSIDPATGSCPLSRKEYHTNGTHSRVRCDSKDWAYHNIRPFKFATE